MSSVRPLSGITVIEIGHSVAAPYAGMILGELGAEVIKVENPKGGDACRGWGPPFSDGTATAFHAFNRAKQGIAIDLTDPAQAERLRALIRERADVLIHNLKFGTPDRYRLSAGVLTAEKPSLVYCNIGAFGATGPLRDRPGYDPMMQAYGGLMSLLGENGRPPVRVTVSIIDIATAMWAVIGILAALQERMRTGRGGVVDTSLYETTLAWMSLPISAYLADGETPERHGSGVGPIVPYQVFAAADGYIMVAAGNDNLFRRLCDAIGRPGLSQDPRFRTNSERVVNRGALISILSDLFAAQPIATWAKRLDSAGIPNGPIQTIDQVVTDPQTTALGIIQQLGSISLVGLPVSFDGARPPFAKLAPQLGEDNPKIVDPLR
ncbi:MAG: CoA transferase [Alphaproteobacteria bacterium]|nr:CoA transferase [Alphaproteobacteria bacterium]MBV9814225.1 CoA transferase [Alphaproteobacteria bacterium]